MQKFITNTYIQKCQHYLLQKFVHKQMYIYTEKNPNNCACDSLIATVSH